MRAESKYGIYPTWSDMLALLGVFVAATVLCNMLGVLLVRTGSVSEGFSAFVCYGVQFAVTILYALWVRRHRTARGTKLLRFGVRRVDPAVVLWGLVMTIATSLVVEPLVDWMPEGMLELLNRQMGLGVAEIIRAGIQAVDKGQMEGARSCGMTNAQAMRYVVMPQAVKNILPAIGNEFVTMVKETSIIQYLGIGDLMYNNGIVVTSTYNPLPCYYISAIIYLALNIILGKGLNIFEGRLRKSER